MSGSGSAGPVADLLALLTRDVSAVTLRDALIIEGETDDSDDFVSAIDDLYACPASFRSVHPGFALAATFYVAGLSHAMDRRPATVPAQDWATSLLVLVLALLTHAVDGPFSGDIPELVRRARMCARRLGRSYEAALEAFLQWLAEQPRLEDEREYLRGARE